MAISVFSPYGELMLCYNDSITDYHDKKEDEVYQYQILGETIVDLRINETLQTGAVSNQRKRENQKTRHVW